jgi:hypothetical protein
MTQTGRRQWFNFVWYQALWLTAIAGGPPLTGALLLLLLVHLLWVDCWRSEVMLMLGCALPGCAADSLLAHLGVFVFEPAPAYAPIPLWLVAIWLGFAGTLRHSLRWLSARPGLMAVLAGIGAPLTYLGAARLGAVDFPHGALVTGLWVGTVWTVLAPWLCWLTGQAAAWQATRQNTPSPHSLKEIDHVR